MPEAIAGVFELQANGKSVCRGTAFAVSRKCALTAFHVIGDRTQNKVRGQPLTLRFSGGYTCGATYDDGDGRLDFALLSMESQLTDDFQPIPLTEQAQEADGFVSRGFPPLQGVDILTIAGTIRNLQATIFEGRAAIQLFSHEAGAEMPLGGMSGAPVLVGVNPERAAIGLIRWNPTRPDNPVLSLGGTLFACPVWAVVERRPELRHGLVWVAIPLPAAVLHNLPFMPNPLFTGRKDEMETLRRGLQERGEMAVTQTLAVHGLGGVGKTQLSVQYAWKHLREFDTVLWVRADSDALEASLAGLASVLRLPEAKEREQAVQIQVVLDWLRDHNRWLLIADNADTEEAVRTVRERLPPALPGAVLITSRLNRFPLNIPQLSLDLFSAEEATGYLLARVGERQQHEAGDEPAACKLAEELGYLPLALEQAASFIVEMRWSFAKYQKHFRELLNEPIEGATRYPASVAKTWSITLEQLGPLARTLLRMAAWFAPDAIPREIFSADKEVLSAALALLPKCPVGRGERVMLSDIAIDKALSELDRFSLIHLTRETFSMHRLLQAVEQDSLGEDECKRWIGVVVQLFHAFAPTPPDDIRTWNVWVPLSQHAERLIEHTKRHGIDDLTVALAANQLGLFLHVRGAYAKAEPLYQRALTIREKALGPDSPDVAWSLQSLAVLYHVQGRYAKAEPLHQRALAIREKALSPEHPDVARSLQGLAVLYHVQGRYAEAEPLHQRALAIREKALGPEHPDVATSLNDLAALYHAQDQYEKAEPLYQRALAIREKALGPEHPSVADSLNNLAEIYRKQGRYIDAEPLYQRALAIREKALGPEHPDVATSLNSLAELYRAHGQYEKAEPLYQRALAIREKAFDPDHPDVAWSLNGLAALYHARGQYGKAEPLYQRALAIQEKVLGPEHPDVAWSLDGLAALYYAQGQYGKAKPLYQRALAIREKVLGPEHPDVAWSLNGLAALYQAHDQYGKAEPLYQRALAIREKALGKEHPNVATSLNSLAELYRAQGEYGKAEPLYQRALAIREKTLGPEHPDVAWSLNGLAALYYARGQYAKAEPLYQRALAIREKTLGPEHPDVAWSLNGLAALYYAHDQYGKAEPLYQRALAIREKALGPEHPNVATSLENYASLLGKMARPDEAAPLESRARSIRAKTPTV